MLDLIIESTHGRFSFPSEPSLTSHLDESEAQRNSDMIALLLRSWTALLADSPLNDGRLTRKPLRTFLQFRKKFIAGPLLSFIRQFSNLADKIASSGTLYGEGSLTGSFLPEMSDTPIFSEYLTWYKTGSPEILTFILSFLSFGKKLSYDDPDFDATAFRNWLGVENRLSDLKLDTDVTNVLHRILTELIPALPHDREFWPKFGPGRVCEAGISGVVRKSTALKYDARIDRLFFTGLNANFGLSKERGFSVDKVPDPSNWNASEPCVRYSRLKFVPKDITKSRSICMEPNTYMWAQQAVLDWILTAIDRGAARNFIDLHDQSRNRDLARFGSLTGEIDTIDLSSASDSVSVDLVRQIFPREVLMHLIGTRTGVVKLPGKGQKLFPVKKFAPMGSALCFPVQCLVFTSVVIYAALARSGGLQVGETISTSDDRLNHLSYWIPELFGTSVEDCVSETKFRPASIYGDDICVDSYLTSYVTHLLTTLGFEVNIPKSFRGSQAFRESCGGYYYRGVDVSPLRLRVKHFSETLNPSAYASLVSCCNLAGDRHLRNLHRCLVHYCLFWPLSERKAFSQNPVAFSADRIPNGLAIFSSNPRNSHLRKRYYTDGGSAKDTHVAYQRDEHECIQVTSKTVSFPVDDEKFAVDRYLYWRWWGIRTGDSGDLDFSQGLSRSASSGSRLVRRWMPD